MKEPSTLESGERKSWVEYLPDEDIVFVKCFILASRSLRELAQGQDRTRLWTHCASVFRLPGFHSARKTEGWR